jgi:hypothetical protein
VLSELWAVSWVGGGSVTSEDLGQQWRGGRWMRAAQDNSKGTVDRRPSEVVAGGGGRGE